MTFALDPKLKQDCHQLADWSLSQVLLMNETRFPWLILVPKVAGAKELIDLTSVQQQRLLDESNAVSHFLRDVIGADKLNVAALGNVVSQLHLHHIARFENDAAWPAPVWGRFDPIAYSQDELSGFKQRFDAFFASEIL